MQLNSVYLYSNKVDVFTNALASWQTERYRRVYNRNLKVFRSVDNRIDLQVRNSDQKSADISGSTVVFNIIARAGKDLILKKDCITQSASTGKVYVVLTKEELENLESGSYNFSIVQEVRETIDSTDHRVVSRTPMYTDSQYGVIGILEVLGDVFGEADDSLLIDKFDYVNPASTGSTDARYYISSIVDPRSETVVPTSLHTFQLYFTNYTGSVIVQGSLENSATPNRWVNILDPISYVGVSKEYINVVGKYNWLRIKHLPTTGTVDKILYR